jgi:hypothetical protein
MSGVVSPAEEARPLNILSIQSWVAYGHVGNAARCSRCSGWGRRSGR